MIYTIDMIIMIILKTLSKSLTITRGVGYKPPIMFRDHGHHGSWHHHHTGGGLAIVFAALTQI